MVAFYLYVCLCVCVVCVYVHMCVCVRPSIFLFVPGEQKIIEEKDLW